MGYPQGDRNVSIAIALQHIQERNPIPNIQIMAVVDRFNFVALDMIEDPDDYRPNSKLALVVDPGDDENGLVEKMSVFKEQIAAGDKIPLHQHSIDEILVVNKGDIEVSLGNRKQKVKDGAVVFIPAKVAHGFKNIGNDTAHIVAVFPSREVDINYLDRNPAPGTENQDPADPMAIDIREFVLGEMEKAVRPVDKERFRK
jgi:quercetin dioxygenase-like cupin family protein